MDKGIPLRDGCPPDVQPVDGAGRTEPGGVSRTVGASRLGALSATAGAVACGDPVILEGTFGWAWMAQELQACGLEPHLCNGRKVDRWREAKGLAKTNRIDANLIRELWAESTRWWEVWRAEIGDLGRFASRKKLAAYAWLAPRAQDRGEETGATPVGRHVGHQGCRTLKWAFLEAAHGAVAAIRGAMPRSIGRA